jgi:ComF family protein
MMFDLILDFLFPRYCVGCGKYGKDLCKKCFRELSIADQICPECEEESLMGWTHPRCKSKEGMDGLIVIYDYQDEKVRAAVDGIKYCFVKDLVKSLLRNFRFETGEVFDYLVPVPLHYYRENWRGFNQGEEIAKEVGKKMKLEVVNMLRRTRKTKQQALIVKREEREANVKGAFEVWDEIKEQTKGKKVLLIDDVFTSGADMRECTKVLKKAGVEMVWGLALAH